MQQKVKKFKVNTNFMKFKKVQTIKIGFLKSKREEHEVEEKILLSM